MDVLLDVIHDIVYDYLRGRKPEVEIDLNQENLFHENNIHKKKEIHDQVQVVKKLEKPLFL